MNKKKILVLLVAMLTLVLASIGGTMAYLTDQDTVQNQATIGKVDVEIEQLGEANASLAPGAQIDRVTSAINTGNNPCWIRVKVTMPTFTDLAGKMDQKLFIIDMDEKYWSEVVDGYYYYNSPVAPQGKTEPLFHIVVLNENYREGAMLSNPNTPASETIVADLAVVAEAVQSEGLEATTAQAAFTAVAK